METPFIGSAAVRAGRLTAYQLRTSCRPIYPDVYVSHPCEPSLKTRALGAWLWSEKRATLAGLAAAAAHGAQWIAEDTAVELLWRNQHPPAGIVTRNERFARDEAGWAWKLPVTTPARTAFDLGRHLDRAEAVARLDALMHATPFRADDVQLLARRYRGARGLKALRAVLPLVDGGAASPRETWLRLLLIDGGLPRPTTQLPAVTTSGRVVRMLDMGWKEYMVAVEYDGDQHRTDRRQYVKDMRVLSRLAAMGWIVVRVISGASGGPGTRHRRAGSTGSRRPWLPRH